MQFLLGLRELHVHLWECSFSGGDGVVKEALGVELWVVGTEVDYATDYQSGC